MTLICRLAYAFRIRVSDVFFRPWAAFCGSVFCFALSIPLWKLAPPWSLSLLCQSHRILLRTGLSGAISIRLNRLIELALKRAVAPDGLVETVAARPARVQEPDLKAARGAGLVLKAPQYEDGRVVEKGALLLKNTERLDSFRRSARMLPILERYALILEPSWSAYAHPKLLSFCIFRDHPIVVLSPCRADHQFLERLGVNLRPVPAGPGDWVDPRIFRPLEGCEKKFDAVMVARWTHLKGHHLMLRALQRINDPSFRVAFVALNSARDTDREAILSMIRKHRCADQVTIFEDLEPAGVNRVLNQSKVNLLLSRQEGGNRALFEGFFAGVPGVAFSNHIGIPLTHFTPQTGRLIAQRELVDALLHFRAHGREFDPRPWALANIAPEVTTHNLNRALKQLAEEKQKRWTGEIACKCNRPRLHYYPDEASGQGFASMEDLLDRPAEPPLLSMPASTSTTSVQPLTRAR